MNKLFVVMLSTVITLTAITPRDSVIHVDNVKTQLVHKPTLTIPSLPTMLITKKDPHINNQTPNQPQFEITPFSGPPGIAPEIKVAFDPNNDNKIILANGRFVFFSNDGGNNWVSKIISSGQPKINSIEIAKSNPEFGVIVGWYIYCFTHNLQNIEQWQCRQTGHENINDVEFNPLDENEIFYISNEIGLLKSSDGGENIIVLNSTMKGTSLLYDRYREMLFLGTDQGLCIIMVPEFNECKNNVLSGLNIISLSGSFSEQKSAVIALTNSNYIWKSNDMGESWHNITNFAVPVDGGFYPGKLVINPINENEIFQSVWFNGIYKTQDGGISWVSLNDKLYDQWSTDITISNINPNSLIYTVYGAGSVFKTVDGGNSWTEIVNSIHLHRCDSVFLGVDGQYMYSSVGAGGIYRSKDHGITWQRGIGMEKTGEVMEITGDPVDPSILYAVDVDEGGWKSTDYGKNWTKIFDRWSGFNYRQMDIDVSNTDRNILYLAAGNGGIFKSIDSGNSWSKVSNGFSDLFFSVVSINPEDPNVVLAASSQDLWESFPPFQAVKIFRTTDGGISWSLVADVIPDKIDLPNSSLEIVFDPYSENVYAAIVGIGILISMDNGVNWDNIWPTQGGKKLLLNGTNKTDPILIGIDGTRLFVFNTITYAYNVAESSEECIFLDIMKARNGVLYIGTLLCGIVQVNIPSFADVLTTNWAWSWIERLYAAGVTSGCSMNPLMYCPEDSITRAQMAIFLERGMNGSAFIPPVGTGTVFVDVPLTYWAVNWIEKLYADGITSGCIDSPLSYCPEDSVTRAQMAVFLLRAKYGAAYTPPAAVGIFADVPTSYWAVNWIERLYAEGITSGCGTSPLTYCPEDSVNRAQMAVFLVRTFNLP